MITGFDKLHPISFDKNLLVMKPVMIIGWLDGDDLRKLFKQTDEYLENWQPGLANNRDKYILLEHCVIKILWEPQEKLSAHALEMVELLKSDLSIDIAESAGLVMKLYDYYTNQPLNYTMKAKALFTFFSFWQTYLSWRRIRIGRCILDFKQK